MKSGKRVVDVSREAMRLFMDHGWPGNVRELENAIEHSFVLCTHDRIEADDLPENLCFLSQAHGAVQHQGAVEAKPQRRRSVSKEDLTGLLRDCGWNKAEVARRLGVSRTAVWKYMKKYGIPLQGN